MSDIVVRLGECPCPGTPHTEEHVEIEPEATLAMCLRAYKVMAAAEGSFAAKYAAIISAYVPSCITSWSFLELVDGAMKPVPINAENAERLLPWDKGGYEVAEKADELYSGRVFRPLVRRLPKVSPPSPTADSTSQNPAPGSPIPTPSGPSSPSASAGKRSAAPVQ